MSLEKELAGRKLQLRARRLIKLEKARALKRSDWLVIDIFDANLSANLKTRHMHAKPGRPRLFGKRAVLLQSLFRWTV